MNKQITRRVFLKNTSIAAAGLTLAGTGSCSSVPEGTKNKLPRWKGFNLLDLFSPVPPSNPESAVRTTEDDLKWMAGWGFDFVRIPMAYPRYLSFDRTRDITKDEVYNFDPAVLEQVDRLITMANGSGLHISLNLHRGPGYCINAGFHEPFNLWKDKEAQDAFNAHWKMWAERYKSISPDKLSFDLLNEPAYIEDMNDQYAQKSPVPGDIYRKIAREASEAIWSANPDRLVIADGNRGGSNVTPELADLNLAQSCRGYWPGSQTTFGIYCIHYRCTYSGIPYTGSMGQKIPYRYFPFCGYRHIGCVFFIERIKHPWM